MAIDIDGTLVGTGNMVREDVWEALAEARARGLRLAVCSGRPAMGNALAYACSLDPSGWHVFQNGASIVKVDSGESLSEAFPAHLLPGLIAKARSNGRLLEIYTDTEYAVTRPGDYAERHAALLGLPYQPREPGELHGTVVRVQWVVPMEETAAVLADENPELEFHPAGSPVMPDVNFISVTKAGVDKGSAIQRVAAKYGLTREQVMAVGDGENDRLALLASGHPVAMGNASLALKEVARHVVGHVDEGGLKEAVALALQL